MLTVITRSGIISRLPCSLLDKSLVGRIALQFNKCSSYVGGYVTHDLTRFLRKNYRKPLRSSIQSFNSNSVSSYSTNLWISILFVIFKINNCLCTLFMLETYCLYDFISELTSTQYLKVCEETLDSLSEYFEELVEKAAHLPDADVTYGVCILITRYMIYVHVIVSVKFLFAGWRANYSVWRPIWYLCYKSPNSKQTDLAVFSKIWT